MMDCFCVVDLEVDIKFDFMLVLDVDVWVEELVCS